MSLNSYVIKAVGQKAWHGRRCFIIGGGPSLLSIDPARLSGELLLGVNKAFQFCDVTLNYAMDVGFYDTLTNPQKIDPVQVETARAWNAYKGIKVFLQINRKFKYTDNIYIVKRLLQPTISRKVDAGIYAGDNSGFGAMMLAVALGANPIYLLGFDMRVRLNDREVMVHDNEYANRGRTHWHEGYTNQKPRKLQIKLDTFKETFEEMAPALAKTEIEVVNLGPDSGLACFPFNNIDNVLTM